VSKDTVFSTIVYDWSLRDAEIRFLIIDQLSLLAPCKLFIQLLIFYN